MQEVGGSPVGLESELGGDGNETEVGYDVTPPVPSSPSGTSVGPEGASGPDSSAEGGLPPRPRFNRYAGSAVVEQMVSLRREGLTVDEIAERVGFHWTTVSKHLKRAGLTLRTDVSDESFQQRVRQVYAETGTIKGTAKRLGVSRGTVRKVLRGIAAILQSHFVRRYGNLLLLMKVSNALRVSSKWARCRLLMDFLPSPQTRSMGFLLGL